MDVKCENCSLCKWDGGDIFVFFSWRRNYVFVWFLVEVMCVDVCVFIWLWIESF